MALQATQQAEHPARGRQCIAESIARGRTMLSQPARDPQPFIVERRRLLRAPDAIPIGWVHVSRRLFERFSFGNKLGRKPCQRAPHLAEPLENRA